MSWKINREVEKAREEEALMREFEFMKKYGVDISNVPFGMAAMLEAACHAAYNRGWADCKAKVDIPDTRVGEWIPCGKEKPRGGENIATVKWYDGTIEVIHAYYTGFEWITGCGERADIIAWMPLPEPYKVGDQE